MTDRKRSASIQAQPVIPALSADEEPEKACHRSRRSRRVRLWVQMKSRKGHAVYPGAAGDSGPECR
jgi:hypothetical protein